MLSTTFIALAHRRPARAGARHLVAPATGVPRGHSCAARRLGGPGDRRAVRPGDSEIHSEALVTETLIAAVRPGHPLAKAKTVTPQRFAAADHIVVSRRGRAHGPIDEQLTELGLSRRVVAVVPTFASALFLASETDVVCIAPARLAQRMLDASELRALPDPSRAAVGDRRHGVASTQPPRPHAPTAARTRPSHHGHRRRGRQSVTASCTARASACAAAHDLDEPGHHERETDADGDRQERVLLEQDAAEVAGERGVGAPGRGGERDEQHVPAEREADEPGGQRGQVTPDRDEARGHQDEAAAGVELTGEPVVRRAAFGARRETLEQAQCRTAVPPCTGPCRRGRRRVSWRR